MKVILYFLIFNITSNVLFAQFDTCTLPKPVNLFITHEGICKTTLHWDTVAGAQYYGVKYRITSSPDPGYTILNPVQTDSAFIPGVIPFTEYTFGASAMCSVIL